MVQQSKRSNADKTEEFHHMEIQVFFFSLSFTMKAIVLIINEGNIILKRCEVLFSFVWGDDETH